MTTLRDKDFYAAIAAQVISRRQELGLSQRQLAELCGTTQPAIARFESGRRPPKMDTLLAMADALDASLEVLFRPRTKPRTLKR